MLTERSGTGRRRRLLSAALAASARWQDAGARASVTVLWTTIVLMALLAAAFLAGVGAGPDAGPVAALVAGGVLGLCLLARSPRLSLVVPVRVPRPTFDAPVDPHTRLPSSALVTVTARPRGPSPEPSAA